MPFITQKRRDAIETGTLTDLLEGDLCYIYYKEMVEEWRENPRWTTAHNIYGKMVCGNSLTFTEKTAYELAWQVFFNLYVMPYENEKRMIHGDI